MTRLAFDQLAPYIEARWRPHTAHISHIGIHGKTVHVLGIPRRTAHRWSALGVPVSKADRVANTLGMHPASIWPDWWSVS